MPELYLKTIDNAAIFANWSSVEGSAKVALFLHQRSKDHTIWNNLRKMLHEKGWSTLAIDLRGHGKSDGFRPQTRADFTPNQSLRHGTGQARTDAEKNSLRFDRVDNYHSMMFDVTAAADFIRNEFSALSPQQNSGQAAKSYELAVIGSSIGANLALAYAADHFEVKATVLLSPGLDYFGLRTDDVMIQYHRPLVLLTAKDDPSYPDVQKLIKLPGVARQNLWYQEFDTGGHGVRLLEAHPEMMEKIAEWMEKQIA